MTCDVARELHRLAPALARRLICLHQHGVPRRLPVFATRSENCTGASREPVLPIPSWSAGTMCRAATGACDAAETCTDRRTIARPTHRGGRHRVPRGGRVCDVAETCTGSSSTCPADAFAASGTICRALAGNCDEAETCTGSSVELPCRYIRERGNVCRAATNECDEAESCTGASGTCPATCSRPPVPPAPTTATSAPPTPATSATAQGLSVTYFANNDLTRYDVTRIDSTVDFNWGGSTSPDPAIPTTNFSARWTGQVLAPNTGSYTFETEATTAFVSTSTACS